jgi:hypothetical protein
MNGGTVTISVPAGALPTGTTVSEYPVTNSTALGSEVPTGQSFVVALAVTWQTPSGTSPESTTPLTIAITDSTIVVGDPIYVATSSGLTPVGNATSAGSVTVIFETDPVFVVTVKLTRTPPARPAPETVSFASVSSELNAGARRSLLALATKLIPGASITVTGCAMGDSVLARERAWEAVRLLEGRISIHVTIKISGAPRNTVTIITNRQ